jgi:hypothetical protein
MRPSWCSSFLCFISFIFLLASTSLAWSQELSSQPGSGAKVCVAEVNNRTGKSLFVERMTERLVRGLIEGKLAALAMDSATTSDRELRPTLENSEELKRRECNYLVLTQVADPKSRPTEPVIPPISIGGKVPNVDASDPLGGQSGPQYRENLEVNFAVFRPGSTKPVLNTRILDQPSGNVSDSMMQTMDREANRIGRELKK